MSKDAAPPSEPAPDLAALESMLGSGGPQPQAPTPAPVAEPAAQVQTGEPSEYPSMQELQAIAAIANGKAPMPGEEPPATPPAPTTSAPQASVSPSAPSPPAAPEWMQAIQAQNAAFQSQMQTLMQLVVQQQQPAPMPPAPPTYQERTQRIAAEMRAAGLDPTNEHQVLNYQLWQQQQERESHWEQRFAEQEQRWRDIYAHAQHATLRDDVSSRVEANLKPFTSIPEATKRSIHDIAVLYAQQGMAADKAVEHALAGVMPLLQKPQAGPAPAPTSLSLQPTPVPAFAGVSPQDAAARMRAMGAVTVPGRTAGRGDKIPSLDELEGLVTRGPRMNGRIVRS